MATALSSSPAYSGVNPKEVQATDPTPWPLDHLTTRGEADAPALIDAAGTLTFAAFDLAVGRLARALLGRGLRPGERVATWLPKNRLSCLMPLAAVRAGLVHVPINAALRQAQAAHILADSEASLLIANPARLASLESGPWQAVDSDAASEWLAEGEGKSPSRADPADLAALLYTSGSTGKPKGVMVSSTNLWLGAVSVASYLELAPHDRTLAVLPLAFDYGQNQLLSAWAAGSAAVPFDYLLPSDVPKAVERFAITTLAGVPPLWVQLVEARWSQPAIASLNRLTNSGGAVALPLFERMRALFPGADIHLMYGLTEAFRSTALPPALADETPWSIGRAIPFAEIMIVNEEGEPADDGAPGELVHAGPLVAAGYWNDAEWTRARFRPAPAWSTLGGIAVWSGDKAIREANGLHRFVGREDEMIKVSGNRISPQEIEEAALACPGVSEAAAFGIPDERLGQAIYLVVRASDFEKTSLVSYLKHELPAFMQPRMIEVRDTLPRSPNGKIDRAALRAALAR